MTVQLTPTPTDARSPETPPRRPPARRRRPAGRVVAFVLLLAGSFAFIYPFLWMLATSLRSLPEIGDAGISIWPKHWHWANYRNAFSTFPFWRYLTNSLLTTLITIVGTVVASAMAGFAFARLRVRGSNALFLVVLATMLIPTEVTLVPQFMLFKQLGMIDTLYPLILPQFFGMPFYIFLFRQFFARIPESLADAATIDGCGYFRTWWSIYLPLSRPIVAASSVLLFINYWNRFLEPAIFVTSDRWKTLPLALAGMQSVHRTDTPLLMALTVVVTLPCIALFFLAQRSFIEGITFTGTSS